MPFIVDTDWVIQSLAGRAPALRVLRRLAPAGVAVSVVTVGEVQEGAYNAANPRAYIERFRRFLAPYPVLNVTEPIIGRFAEIRAFLRQRGQIIPDFDIVIAATALYYNLTVLTFNLRHFGRIPDLHVYQPG